MIFPWNKKAVDYSKLFSELEKGEATDIRNLLWQPPNQTIEYLSIVYNMLSKFKKPNNSSSGLSIHEKFERGKYELLVLIIPWAENYIKYSPILIDKSNSKIVGMMLPFNELHEVLSEKETHSLSELGMLWTNFIMKIRFK